MNSNLLLDNLFSSLPEILHLVLYLLLVIRAVYNNNIGTIKKTLLAQIRMNPSLSTYIFIEKTRIVS